MHRYFSSKIDYHLWLFFKKLRDPTLVICLCIKGKLYHYCTNQQKTHALGWELIPRVLVYLIEHCNQASDWLESYPTQDSPVFSQEGKLFHQKICFWHIFIINIISQSIWNSPRLLSSKSNIFAIQILLLLQKCSASTICM